MTYQSQSIMELIITKYVVNLSIIVVSYFMVKKMLVYIRTSTSCI